MDRDHRGVHVSLTYTFAGHGPDNNTKKTFCFNYNNPPIWSPSPSRPSLPSLSWFTDIACTRLSKQCACTHAQLFLARGALVRVPKLYLKDRMRFRLHEHCDVRTPYTGIPRIACTPAIVVQRPRQSLAVNRV